MTRTALIPLILIAVAIIGVLALGIPTGAPTAAPYEKTLDVAK